MEEITFKLESFEGPFDLLYKLIEKNKIDIYDIPISELTEQYINYINDMEQEKMESMSEFIIMAATLLEIKSKMLLPKEVNEEEEEIDPREELVQRLIEYKKYKEVSEVFGEIQKTGGQPIFKDEDREIMREVKKQAPYTMEEVLEGIDMDMLYAAFEEVLKRKEIRTDKIRSGFNSVKKALYNIDDRIKYIKDLLTLKGEIKFSNIFRKTSSKAEVVVTFLAMLELIKEKMVRVRQDNIFEEITISMEEERTVS